MGAIRKIYRSLPHRKVAVAAAAAVAAALAAGECAVIEDARHRRSLAEPQQPVKGALLVPHLPQKRKAIL